MVEKVGTADFEEEVLKSPVPVLVDFFQLHCLPCKRMDPVLEELQQRIGEKGRVRCVQFEDDPHLVFTYDVMSFPTMILFVDGEPKKRYIGPKPIEMLLEMFDGAKPSEQPSAAQSIEERFAL